MHPQNEEVWPILVSLTSDLSMEMNVQSFQDFPYIKRILRVTFPSNVLPVDIFPTANF